jgi:hypothetical protein
VLVSLDTPYVDTSAADLSLALGGPERPALHVLDLALPGGTRVHLRLLGASHQVMLDAPGTTLAETVACLPGRTPELPAAQRDDDTGYRFTATVRRPDDLHTEITALRAELAGDPYALVGVFPGDPDAVTALRVRPVVDPTLPGAAGAGRSVGWQTWHAYPQTNELVLTETMVTLR